MLPNATRAFDWECPLPRFYRMNQEFPRPRVPDVAEAVTAAMDRLGNAATLGAGRRVAITAGSRGINQIARVLAVVVDRVRAYGGEPFLVPAMGSHGAATAAGQLALLSGLGITEKTVRAPIIASMDTVQIGELESGMPVYMDRHAAEAEAIVIVNRVKPHTDFSGDWESGLAKMTAIGLGKQRGADTIHRYGVTGLRDWMPEAARLIVQRTPVAFGLAIIENAYDEIAAITAVPSEQIAGSAEAELLTMARSLMPRLPFDEIDVLIVDELGKNISGAGMDSKILGRMKVHGISEPDFPNVRTIVVLGLTPESHGNAVGIGLADVTTQRLVQEVDFEAVYINALTSGITGVQRAALPVVAPSDRAAILAGLRVCGRHDPENARVVRIKNTLELGTVDVSECLLRAGTAQTVLQSASSPFELRFGPDGQIWAFGASL